MPATDRVRPHILRSEATCNCGCEGVQGDLWLDIVNTLIDICGFPIGISTMYRCNIYNDEIGGVDDSPHKEKHGTYGAADLKCHDSKKRMILLRNIMELEKLGDINHVEVCNGHIHIANVPMMHRCYESCHWGESK